MDCGARKDMCDKHKPMDSCLRPSQKLDKSITTVDDNKDAAKLSEVADCPVSLVPITPDADRENGDFPIDLKSPLTVMKKPFKLSAVDSNCDENGCNVAFVDHGSPKTPKDAVFDPFAAASDIKAWAPQCKKYLNDPRSCVARQLSFNPSFDDVKHKPSGYDVESLSDQEMFESVYENLLEAIVSMQAEGFLAEMSDVVYDSDDCKTPPSAVRLNGIADTCPGAPVKVGNNKPRIFPSGLCRKLEF